MQAGLLVGMFVHERGATYQTASFEQAAANATTQGSFALVRFNPEASASDITKFFDVYKASLVEGPRAGGVYRIRVAAATLPKDELSKIVARMGEDKGVVAFIVPAP